MKQEPMRNKKKCKNPFKHLEGKTQIIIIKNR